MFETISLKEALSIMNEKQDKFSISFWDKKGNLLELSNCEKCGLKKGINDKQYVGIRQIHSSRHDTTVHIRLIEYFNGKKVYWA